MLPHIGPVILDLAGTDLSAEEKELLQHPLVGGVILFTRNYDNPQQISELCQSIRRGRQHPLLIAVDHEGGRVQRFREGLTVLPAMGKLGQLYDQDPEKALDLAENCGSLMAAELLALGIDLSFAPVLDLNKDINSMIGDRSFHGDYQIVVRLAKKMMLGMKKTGMIATGKHFPGHGSVAVDSHLTLPIDSRDFATVAQQDLIPFAELIAAGIQAIMPAHILFPAIDDKPVGFSNYWLHNILRQQLKFSGVIISDDLNMKGAENGNYADRASHALSAGCNMILICNNRNGAISILDHLPQHFLLAREKFNLLQGHFSQNFSELTASSFWKKHHALINQFRESL